MIYGLFTAARDHLTEGGRDRRHPKKTRGRVGTRFFADFISVGASYRKESGYQVIACEKH